ncbi:MAG: B12-binding domain-containing radical SAM protein [Candidatus Odinarchaeota archaeon]
MTIALVKISSISDRLIPLGLACLQAYLKHYDVQVKVYNFRATEYDLPKIASDPLIQLKPPNFIMNHQDFPISIAIAEYILNNKEICFDKDEFVDLTNDYANRLYENPETTQNRYMNMMSHVEGNISKLCNRYSKVAFSLDYLNIVETIMASCLLKYQNPKIQIIWGGPSITQSYKAFRFFLQKGVCDGFVIGEGEKPLLDIAKDFNLKNVKGVMSLNKNNDTFYFTSGIQLDLNSLPTPDYTNIPLDTYFQIASVYRSRGCTNRCKFCAEWNLFGPRFRIRSVENVIDDIEIIIEKHKPQYMIFGESLINDDLQYFERLCDAMIERNFNMHFGTHFRANITQKLAKKAYQAGFNDAWVGFEAFSDQDLKEMNKGISVNQNINTINNLTSAGVNVIAMLVVGFSNLKEEIKNCNNIIKTIEHYSQEKFIINGENETPLSIQWRPAPIYIVPGSLDYHEKELTELMPWKFKNNSVHNTLYINDLEKKLSKIPYEFKRPIEDKKVGELMKMIQDADRNAGFAIGGLAEHIINFMIKERRKIRQLKKIEKVGVIAQRYNSSISKS